MDIQPPDPCLTLLSDLGRERALGGGISLQRARPLAARVWHDSGEVELAVAALCDPYLALTMLWRTLALGLRGNPVHPRPRDPAGPALTADLLAFLRLHLRLRGDLPALVDWPAGGLDHRQLHGDGGWCDLCGECCCHAGTVPTPPPGVEYPAYWYHALAGSTLHPQPFCPFLFQAQGLPMFFCALHPIKPLACGRFGQGDCRRGRPHRGYRQMPGGTVATVGKSSQGIARRGMS